MAIQDNVMLELLNNAGTADFGAAETGTVVTMDTSPFLPHKKADLFVTGTYVGTMKISGSDDNSTWTDYAIAVNGGAGTTETTPHIAAVSLKKYMRAQCTAYTSGAAKVRMIAFP